MSLTSKQRLEFCIRFRSANAEVAFETHKQIWPKMQLQMRFEEEEKEEEEEEEDEMKK